MSGSRFSARALAGATVLALGLGSAVAQGAPSPFEPDAAIAYSQAAVGREVANGAFVDREGRPVRLSDFRGKPLVVNLVFTACAQSCPVVVQSLARAVDVAADGLGADSFSVITVGFDAANDTPARMRAYAHSQGVDRPNWRFLSADAETLERLLDDLGFVYSPSPLGFDHIAQVSVLDADGRVHQQVYGANFTPPALVEPLKALLFGRVESLASLGDIVERVRLFCTFYDPSRDRYSFDYSFFIALVVGGATLTGMAIVLVRAWLRADKPARDA